MKYLILLLLVCFIGLVNASPYILNLTDGNLNLIDLNLTNDSSNFTIYVIHQYTNISINQTNFYNYTYQNYTQNITYLNTTCINCTNYNDTYISYGYNKTDLDNKLITKLNIDDFNSYKSGLTYATKDEVTGQINNLNSSITPSKSDTGNLWMMVIIEGIVIFLIVLFIIYKIGSGD